MTAEIQEPLPIFDTLTLAAVRQNPKDLKWHATPLLAAGGVAFGGAGHAYGYSATESGKILRYDPLHGTGSELTKTDLDMYEDEVAQTLYLIPPSANRMSDQMLELLKIQFPLIVQVDDTSRTPSGIKMWRTNETHLYYTRRILQKEYHLG